MSAPMQPHDRARIESTITNGIGFTLYGHDGRQISYQVSDDPNEHIPHPEVIGVSDDELAEAKRIAARVMDDLTALGVLDDTFHPIGTAEVPLTLEDGGRIGTIKVELYGRVPPHGITTTGVPR